MAIFHATTKPISRSSGRSATASAAYRAGCEIEDERTGLTYDYSKRSGVLITAAFDKNLEVLDRNKLWNLAEQAENRKDSRTAREWVLAIPNELIPTIENANNERQHHNALTDINKNNGAWVAFRFAQELAIRYNVGVDVAIHAPDVGGDNRNYHAHILTTTRELKNENGQLSLGCKSLLEQSNTKRKETDSGSSIGDIKELRALWADIVNEALELSHIDARIDHRSHKERELETQPTIKMGWRATAMERKGVATDRGDINRAIMANNAQIKCLQAEIEGDKHYLRWQQEAHTFRQARLGRERLALQRLEEQTAIKERQRIEKRTPHELLRLRLGVKVTENDSSGKQIAIYKDVITPISPPLLLLLREAERKNYHVSMSKQDFRGGLMNPEYAQNPTALAFERFMLNADNLKNPVIMRDFMDDGSGRALGVADFAKKYGITCDFSDLQRLDALTPVPKPSTSQKLIESHIEPTADNNHNLSM